MTAVSFEIEPAVRRRFPQVMVGGFIVDELATASVAAQDTERVTAEARRRIESAGIDPNNLVQEERIAAWRRAMTDCGLKASRHRSSPEQLARRLLKDRSVSTPLAVVDYYCAVSLEHLSPLGGYDVDRLPAPRVALREGRPGGDSFQPLGGSPGDMPITERVVVYASASTVLCWAFNVRDSRETCLRAETGRAVFFGEAVSSGQHDALRTALEELHGGLIERGARPGQPAFFSAANPAGELTGVSP